MTSASTHESGPVSFSDAENDNGPTSFSDAENSADEMKDEEFDTRSEVSSSTSQPSMSSPSSRSGEDPKLGATQTNSGGALQILWVNLV
jgi:hypothetical protein